MVQHEQLRTPPEAHQHRCKSILVNVAHNRFTVVPQPHVLLLLVQPCVCLWRSFAHRLEIATLPYHSLLRRRAEQSVIAALERRASRRYFDRHSRDCSQECCIAALQVRFDDAGVERVGSDAYSINRSVSSPLKRRRPTMTTHPGYHIYR
jgi:hypothetical protein